MTTDRRLERLARTSPGRSTTAWVATTAAWSLIALGAVSVAAPAARAQSAADRYELDRDRKQDRDRTFRRLSEGVLTMKKRSYASTADGLEIPFYVFEPLRLRGPRQHAALVWIHGGVHGDLDPTYFPFIREAVARGYVILAPEYRGSTGYGREHHEALDYGGDEVEDCLTAVVYLREEMPYVDPERLGIIGWSHGGFIALHAVFRDLTFKAAAALVPVSNLVFRLSYKGPRYARHFVAQPGIDGPVHERREIYVDRSPLYHVDKLQTPLLVHVADNDRDVNFEEAQQLIHALEYLKPDLAETRIYHDPPVDQFGGGHRFNRRVDRDRGYRRVDSPEQRDSWNRIWTFFEWHLRPYRAPAR